MRGCRWSIELCSDNSSTIADHDLHTAGNSSFGLARDVVGWPSKDECHRRVNTTSCEKHTRILCARCCGRQKDDVSYDGEGTGADDEDGSFMRAFRKDRKNKCAHESERVWRNGQELRLSCCVSKIFDDAR